MKKITVFLVALVLVMGQVGILCAAPVTIDNTNRPIVLGNPASGELSLQEILDGFFSGPVDAVGDQQKTAMFSSVGTPGAGGTASALPVLIAEYSANDGNQSFGLFSATSTGGPISTLEVFAGPSTPGDSATIKWVTADSGTITKGGVDTNFNDIPYDWFGFYYGYTSPTSTTLYSFDAMNPNFPRDGGTTNAGILAIKDPSGGAWAFACDDLRNDFDYNDMVVYVESVKSAVPLPPSVLLMGSGLLGLGLLRFRRKNRA